MFYVFLFLVTAIDFVLLEFSKHTLLGFILSFVIAAGFAVFFKKVLPGKSGWLKFASWICFIVLLFVAAGVSGPKVKPIKVFTHKNVEATGVVSVQQGDLTGVYNQEKTVEVYAGIPFAAPPVGDLRWAPPQDPSSWEGVRVCDTFAPKAMQARDNIIFGTLTSMAVFHDYEVTLKDNFLEPISEDCLYLNVWKPAGDIKDAPVLFYIHGGSLTSGQSYGGNINGEQLAKRGIVVVTIAYRLGVFGYYANEALMEETKGTYGETGTTGNYGLMDQIKALEWVRNNVSSFGGDPNKITIAGESAGSSSVGGLCVSPLTEGMFVRAIAESSGITPKVPYHTFRTLESALETGRKIQEEFKASSIGDLRKIDAEKLLTTRYSNSSMTVDGYAIKEQPYLTYEKGENHEQALFNGFNVHEADLFALTNKISSENYEASLERIVGDGAKEAARLFPPRPVDKRYKVVIEQGTDAKGSFNVVLSACWFTYSHYDWSRYMVSQGRPVYMYHFTKDNGGLGSNHAGELPYFFGNLFRNAKNYDESDAKLEQIMMTYYENFIKYGDPNAAGDLPTWELYDPEAFNVLELGENVGMIKDPFSPLYPLIDQFQEQLLLERENGASGDDN